MRIDLSIFLVVLVGCAKHGADEPPPVGWHRDEGWALDCYFPPSFETLDETSRRSARADALDQVMSQWSGQRDEGVALGDEELVMDVETVLLGRPSKIEGVIQQNLQHCKQVAATPPE
ncbi:MAG: hypothetical protein QGG40_15440, partial [Myxococcota bacterium]|nr:hypothetical protein [Myxococcota bacterium]